jgi:hypothetical protein
MLTITGSSRVTLHELRTRVESWDDADEWIVGRVETGEFVALPAVAGAVLGALQNNTTIDQARARVLAEIGRDIDVAGFVESLVGLGFVAAVDGVPVAGPAPPRTSLPWLRPEHVRWILRWPILIALMALVLGAIVVLAARPQLLPSYRDLLWTPRASLALVGNAAMSWAIISIHELAHLATARACGIPGRISFGTRLQFLVAQTNVSGVWALRRRQRMTVYLSGIAVNLGVAAIGVILAAVADGAVARLGAAVAVLSTMMIAPQFLVFMRTDLYFVLQDLTGCRNLYADGSAHVRWVVGRLVGRRTNDGDPSRQLPRRERRAVQAYAWMLGIGTAVCVSVAGAVTVPFALTLLATAVHGLATGGAAGRLDGLTTFVVIGGYWIVWASAWWRRHGHRSRAWLARAHRVRRDAGGQPG